LEDITQLASIDATLDSTLKKMKDVMEKIHNESQSGSVHLMEHTSAIFERICTEVEKLKAAQAMDSIHHNLVFEPRTNITNKSIKRTRDYMELYMQAKRRRTRHTV
jgi:hypothetical protein